MAGSCLAQVFSIPSSQYPKGCKGVYCTSANLYFQSKDNTNPVCCHIRPCVTAANNCKVPDCNYIQPSQVIVQPNNVMCSNDSSVPTNIPFPGNSCFLNFDTPYCYVIDPLQSVSYNVFTSVITQRDIITGTLTYASLTVGGMFTTSDGNTWNHYPNENCKFNMNFNCYSNVSSNVVTPPTPPPPAPPNSPPSPPPSVPPTPPAGCCTTANICNSNTDYFNVGNCIGTFTPGENCHCTNSTPITCNNIPSNTTSGTFTCNTTGFSPNTKCCVICPNNNNKCCYVNVTSVTDGSHCVGSYIGCVPTNPDTNCQLSLVSPVISGVCHPSTNSTFCRLDNPTVNSNFYFTNSCGTIFGLNSGASCVCNNVADIPYNTVCTKIPHITPVGCNTACSIRGCSNTYDLDNNHTPCALNSSCDFTDKERVVCSRSNEIAHCGGQKSFCMAVNLCSNTIYSSPCISTQIGCQCISNKVNCDNSSSNAIFNSEIGNFGNCINKHISSPCTCANGQSASQLLCYVDAYVPPATNVMVYCKVQNQYDSDDFDSKCWSPMTCANIGTSSISNTQDFQSNLCFTFPNTAPVVTPANATDLSPYCAHTANANTVSYTNKSNQQFSTFNTYATKVCLQSNQTHIVPKFANVRTIAAS